jgi:hypothetical protein
LLIYMLFCITSFLLPIGVINGLLLLLLWGHGYFIVLGFWMLHLFFSDTKKM